MSMLSRYFINWAEARPRDEWVGAKNDAYMDRWFYIKWGWINLYVHRFNKSDDDRALHDHPGDNISILLEGEYKEWMPLHPSYDQITPPGIYSYKIRKPGFPIFRRAENLHRIELMKVTNIVKTWVAAPEETPVGILTRYVPVTTTVTTEAPCWTLFFRFRHRREWGFMCVGKGWRHWKEFCKPGDQSEIGKGCD